jgi:hypothetical protein
LELLVVTNDLSCKQMRKNIKAISVIQKAHGPAFLLLNTQTLCIPGLPELYFFS